VLGIAAAGCAEPRAGAESAAPAVAVSADTFIPDYDPGDSASLVLAAYLESVREEPASPPDGPPFTVGCGSDTGVVHPVEMLAAWEITGRTPRGDTTVVRARTFTVAEENVMGTTPPRYMAVQRSRDNEWEWDVVRDGDRWRVCNGPRFGFVGHHSNTSWRPSSASHASARAMAESVWRARMRMP
jgi:hypothetical protein